ncbi:MAG: hypothetical protein K1Y36_22270 [Blastocatellia bacterium]|nr:hypothetical protein [Blastocatellia bacterium]
MKVFPLRTSKRNQLFHQLSVALQKQSLLGVAIVQTTGCRVTCHRSGTRAGHGIFLSKAQPGIVTRIAKSKMSD